MIILASHLPGEGHFRSERFEVESIECAGPYDYWEDVSAQWWTGETLVNLEHDIECSDDHLQELLACPEDACSFAYRCHWISTGIPGGVIAAGNGARTADSKMPPEAHYLQGGEEWANWSAIGLVKIAPEARTATLRREPWSRLELAVHDAVSRPWHVHWPEVPHHHW